MGLNFEQTVQGVVCSSIAAKLSSNKRIVLRRGNLAQNQYFFPFKKIVCSRL